MTPDEIEIKLVKDILLIKDSALDSDQYKEKSRAQRLEEIREELNQRRESEIAQELIELNASSRSKQIRSLSKEFVANTIRLLRYRSKLSSIAEIPPISESSSITDEKIQDIIDSTSANDSTVVPLRAISEYKEQNLLKDYLEKRCNKELSVDLLAIDEPADYREKCPAYGHSVWIITPVLPVVKVSAANASA